MFIFYCEKYVVTILINKILRNICKNKTTLKNLLKNYYIVTANENTVLLSKLNNFFDSLKKYNIMYIVDPVINTFVKMLNF